MKRIISVVLLILISLSGCKVQLPKSQVNDDADKINIIGTWEVVTVSESDSYTRISFTDEGKGAWEVGHSDSDSSMRLEFLYVLQDNDLSLVYEGNDWLRFTVDFDNDNLLLIGEKYYILKPVK